MTPADARGLEPGDLVTMRYLGAARWARVQAVTACRVYLTTADVPAHLKPLALEWVRPIVLSTIVLKGRDA